MKTRILFPLILLTATSLAAQSPAAREAAAVGGIPSPAEVLGYALGERFTDHAGVVRYLEALASVSPRVEIRRYGETVEGRPLLQVVVAREDHLSNLDAILARNRELAEPSTTEARAREIAASNPAVVYFSYGIHGNESSSSEAALWTVWDLARGAESVAGVLDSVIVVVDPVVNPDGRDRYVNWFRQAMGARPNPNPDAWEHWEPWPGGRYNHYLFDLNRDWAWMSQPETRARVATWGYWTPQVHVDFHEMSWTSSYFFFPAAEPINPIYPPHILEWARRIGEGNARAFDARGWLYYTGESFDLFYPGYGDSWPSLLGAIGMTYEQAGGGRGGLAVERPDGTVLTLRDRAERHRTTGQATLRTVAAGKTGLLLGFARSQRAIGQDEPDVLLVPGPDASRVEALVALLRAQGIRVERADRPFRAESTPYTGFQRRREFPAGTYRVPARQARGRLATTLLQPETPLDATFSYDVSAWSLPFAYGVEAHQTRRAPDAGWRSIDELPATVAVKTAPDVDEPYGYLVAPSFAAWPRLVRFLAEGGSARVLDREFRMEGREWPAGTIFLPRSRNPELGRLIETSGLDLVATPVRSGFADEGRDLGSNNAYRLEMPRIAVVTGDGVSPTSFGAHWFFLEQTLGVPFDAVPLDRIGAVRLETYDVIVLPDLRRGALGKEVTDRIEDWVRRGGTLVAVAGGASTVADAIAGIQTREGGGGELSGDERLTRALRGRRARELERWEAQVPGTIFELRLDPAHPLAFGAGIDNDPERLFVLHTGTRTFEPDDRFESVAYFPAGTEKVSGVVGPATVERLEKSSWLGVRSVGQGRVILFADDPLFRHFWYSTFQVYTNAILVGPAL